MSAPAIYIAPQGTTPHVPPRYTRPGSRGPHVPPMCDLMVRYSGFSIRHTEFGIRKPRIGNRGTVKSHGAEDSILTRRMMVR
jgi:hypothetical protein